MNQARPILIAALAVALAVYAFDCGAMTTPERAMQCCNSMPCSSQGHHGQDCCKTMPAMHAPFVQPSFVRGVPYAAAMCPVCTLNEATTQSQQRCNMQEDIKPRLVRVDDFVAETLEAKADKMPPWAKSQADN